ncbi:hypothetical protein CP97_13220 [Aurantiacibacter atlanticus]|uniref:Uncharacterized protein n=1 Tax=Aurantiacibacter atlanticus TaxID=1648404 RepID=A0A0H4VIV2_9SPHN|nr:hypothetical protein [Aurantiacibacter atlanticus]AKQ42791.1 hypothetical protein CP97_13220 [Aurantiacibacter atlanticus]MDF1835018.1 hypothetical protein [Alteraurantiacibacter sp. bin_em_oilr2.035]
MDMQDMLQRYFGTSDFAAVGPEAVPAGVDRMLVDFGLEEDRGRKFALWSLLLMFDAAPDLDVAFKLEEDREAARNLMDLMAAASPD